MISDENAYLCRDRAPERMPSPADEMRTRSGPAERHLLERVPAPLPKSR